MNDAGTRAVSMDQGYNIYVWDVESGEKLAQIAPQISESGYIETPVGAYVYEDTIVVCEDKRLRSLTFDGDERWCATVESYFIHCAVNEVAQTVVCIGNDEITIYDVVTGEKVDNVPNLQETSYSSEVAFSEDGTKLAISHYTSSKEATPGCVTVYDFAAKKITDVETIANYITDIEFAADGCLVVAQANNADLLYVSGELVDGHVQKIDYEKQEVLWQNGYQYNLASNESASAQLKCRKYEDAVTGELHDEVILSVDNLAYTLDSMTGEKVVEIQVDSGIVSLLVSANSRFGYLAQYDGTVDIVDMTSGTRYSSSAIETGMQVRQLIIRNSKILFRSYASPNLTMMSYPNNADVTELQSYDLSVEAVTYSPNETYYAVKMYDFDVSNRVCFYRTEDHSLVQEWVVEDGNSSVVSDFISDNVYVTMFLDGTVMFYEVSSGEKNIMSLGEDIYSSDYDINEDRTLALAYCAGNYVIIDLQKQKILSTGTIDGYLHGAVLSEDGSQIYCSVKEQGVCIIDVASGELVPIESGEYRVFNGAEIQDAFAVGSSGRLFAVSCTDGILRVLDVEAMETVAEIPFRGVNRRFIAFVEEDNKLMMQGDDYYFCVYDLEKEEFCYIATEQYNEIKNTVVDESTGTISLFTSADMVILNASDFERSARVDGGEAYLPEQGMIICDYYGTLYQFSYMTLEMLQKEAEEQFGGEKLTAQERIKYNVE